MKTKGLGVAAALTVGLVFAFTNHKALAAGGVGTQDSATTQTAITDIQNATTLAGLDTAMQSFLGQYSMTYSTASVPDTSTFSTTALTAGDFQEAQSFDIELVQEWSKYTPAWVAASQVQTIYAVTNLHVLPLSDASSKRCASYGQGTSNKYVLYDVNCSNNDIYMREVIHHEYAHYLFETENGTVPPSFDAATWTSYNPNGFSYGNGGASCYTVPSPCLIGDHPTSGFVTGYAMSSLAEDEAETYAYVFASYNNQNLNGWIPGDTVLNNKVNLLKTYIASVDATIDSTYISTMHTYAGTNYSSQTASVINIAPPFAGPGTEYLNPDGDGSLIWNIPAGTTGTDGIGIGLFGKINVGPTQTLYLDGSISGTSNAGVEVGQNGTLKGNGTAERYIDVDDGGIIAPGHSPGCLTTNNLLESGTYQAEIGGITPCSGYDQVIVNGGPGNPVTGGLTAVDLTGGTLNTSLSNGFIPSVGQTFTIIDNKSTDPVTATFAGLAEGSTFTSQGVTYSITYKGGTGNDVVLTVTNVNAAVVAAAAGKAPGTPNTGFQLLMARPVLTLGAATTSALMILYVSRRVKYMASH